MSPARYSTSTYKISFNNYVDKSTWCIPFELFYGFQPNTLLNINSLPLPHRPSEAALDFSRYIMDIHEECKRCPILKNCFANFRCKDRQFSMGAMVLICLRPKQFPSGSFTSFMHEG